MLFSSIFFYTKKHFSPKINIFTLLLNKYMHNSHQNLKSVKINIINKVNNDCYVYKKKKKNYIAVLNINCNVLT